jgi:hypothetical protein
LTEGQISRTIRRYPEWRRRPWSRPTPGNLGSLTKVPRPVRCGLATSNH